MVDEIFLDGCDKISARASFLAFEIGELVKFICTPSYNFNRFTSQEKYRRSLLSILKKVGNGRCRWPRYFGIRDVL